MTKAPPPVSPLSLPSPPWHECLGDPLAVGGMKFIARTDPDWRELLHLVWEDPGMLTARLKGIRTDATVLDAMLGYGIEELAPHPDSHASVETVYRNRQLAHRLRVLVGDRQADLVHWDFPTLRSQLIHGARGLGPSSPDRAGRAISLLCKILNRRREMLGLSGRVLPDQPTPAPPRPSRTSTPLKIIELYLNQATQDELPKLAVALGSGLSAGQIDGLKGRDLVKLRPTDRARRRLGLGPREWLVWVRTPAPGGRVHWHLLPRWSVDILFSSGYGGGDWPLFPHTPTILQTMRRLHHELPDVEPVTPSDFVLTWQAIARHAGLPRAIVRRTRSQPAEGPGAGPPKPEPLLALVRRWPTLACPLTAPFFDDRHIVPRKAPRGCPPHEPEIGWPKPAVRPPLPRALRIP